MKKAVGMMLALGMLSASYGAISVDLVGDGFEYDENGVGDFRSMYLTKGFDLDGDNVYGSEGLFFFGDGLPDERSGNDYTCHTQVGAAWATFSQGSNFNGVAEGLDFAYAIIDDPILIPMSDVADWGIRSAVMSATTPAGAGSWCEMLTFDIDETTPSQFRIGILAGNANNINWNPSGLRISVNGDAPAEVIDLDGTIGQANFVFFDVNLNGETSGTFSIQAQRRADTQGASIAGVTFDSTSSVEFPGGALKLGQSTLSLRLVAPDTTTNGIIDAIYLAGDGESDVEILSTTADDGFTASVDSTTLGAANTNEAITVTFDNSVIGLANGESTNSTLVVTWIEAGSAVTNTSEATLNVTYINVPNSFELEPDTLSLVLEDPATSISGTIVASYVAGTVPADADILSAVAGNGFSAMPTSFTLNSVNTNEEITVTYNNTGALGSHGDTAESTLVLTWTDTGSGVINTSEVPLDVFYEKSSQVTELWTIGMDFGATSSTDPNYSWNNVSVGGDASNPGLAAEGVVLIEDVVDLDGAVTDVDFAFTNVSGQIAWDFPTAGINGDGADINHDSVYADSLISNDSPNGGRPVTAGEDYFTFLFTGLDDSFIYDLSGGYNVNNANFHALWSADGQSATTGHGTAADGVGYISLEGLKTDGSGNLQITVTGVEGAAHITVSALTLTAFSIAATEIGDASIDVISGGTQMTICWQGQGGANSYAVEATDDIAHGTWTEIDSGIAGVAGQMCVTNDITADQQFFRVVLED